MRTTATMTPMATWDDVVTMASRLPEVEQSTWFRTPSLKVAGKGFARLREEAEGGLVLICDLDEKAALLASGDPAFYTTPHYDGYGAILVDLAKVDTGQLAELVEQAWRLKAPARARKALDRE
ncbi:MmcQ/YjbR family DNA-binding protein [Lentzea roselyniae]|uniref:MmcQ/YjbR family DNA-binding protein n=2 Tax=Lentzea roselyniae TaxID=531940 RepID=A0ABP7CAH3_9PSEU